MGISTTQSIWRSGGGDQTRTAYCGTGVMTAEWYVADIATQAGNLKNQATTASVTGQNIILPAGAVIIEIATTVASTTAGTLDFGFTLYTSGTASPAALINEQPTTRTTTTLATATLPGASFAVPMSLTQMVYLTARTGASAGTGPCSGYIVYYVEDPYVGMQNV
jgi:hypothetical protein